MPHLPGTPDEIRARVPAVLTAWEFMRDEVLHGGLVDPRLKRLCFSFVANGGELEEGALRTPREQLALDWAYAIAWDSDRADDTLWEGLRAEFSEPELVELGCSIGFALGQQHFERTLGLRAQAGLG